jgi:RsiW-degrading membrane proteinase PrsW (M82 family)
MSRVRTVVATEVILLLGLVATMAAAFLVERSARLDDAVTLGPVARILFAAVPGLLWVGYFRARDSQEYRPRQLVFAMFLAGALVAGPAAQLALDLLLPVDVAAGPIFDRFGAERLVTAFLVVALVQELAKYAVVRYTVYPLSDISQPIDGLVYLTAVALGFAAYRNHAYLSEAGGQILLSTGTARLIVTTLGHACFAALLGLAMGWAKFSPLGPWRRSLVLAGGLVGAVALNGGFATVQSAIAAPGLGFDPWRGLAFAFGFAASVFIAVSFPLRRITARTSSFAP